MKASEIIEGARQLLDREDSWIRGRAFKVEPGGFTRHCVSNALVQAAWNLAGYRTVVNDIVPFARAASYVRQEAGITNAIAAWNDDPMTLYSDVQLVLKRAFHAALEAGD